MSDILKHTKGIIEIYHRLVPDTSQTLRAVSSRAMAEIEEVELKFAALQAEAELHRVAHRGTLDALEAANAFINEMFKLFDWPEGGDVDGGEFQDAAVKHGLLVPETRFEPCAKEDCMCNEYYTGEDFELGVTCYRRAALAATKAGEG